MKQKEISKSDPYVPNDSKNLYVNMEGWRYKYKGPAAKKAILHHLEHWPQAQALAAEICDFYGNCLLYYEDSNLESSRYQINLKHDPIEFNHACVQLQLGTSRTAEALCHELLHLSTRMCGFPFGEKFFIPHDLIDYAATYMGFYPVIGNLVEHELIFEKFIDIGFDKRNFLGCISPPPDYKTLASTAVKSSFYRKEIGFPWWCLEYFRHWISIRHWIGYEPALYADCALFWGSKVHPSMKATTRNIRDLIESGVLTDRKQYHRHVNTLLELMKIPKFTEWTFIKSGKDSTPLVYRLAHKEKINPNGSNSHVLKTMGTTLKHGFQPISLSE